MQYAQLLDISPRPPAVRVFRVRGRRFCRRHGPDGGRTQDASLEEAHRAYAGAAAGQLRRGEMDDHTRVLLYGLAQEEQRMFRLDGKRALITGAGSGIGDGNSLL